MKNIATCPKCHREFNHKESMKFRIDGLSSFFSQIERKRFGPLIKKRGSDGDEIRENLTVTCPNCGTEFLFDEYKLYGLFSPATMKVLIIIFLAMFIAVPIYVLIKDLM